MAVGVLAVLAFQQSLEIVVAPTNVAGLVHRVVEALVQTRVRDGGGALAVADAGEGGPAVGAAVGKFATLEDASEAESVAAVQSPDLLFAQVLQGCQADRALGCVLVPPFQFHLVADCGLSPQLPLEALRAGNLPHEHQALAA